MNQKTPNTSAEGQAGQALAQLQTMQAALAKLRADELGASAFADLAQAQQALLAALPSRFPDVLLQLRSRLESSALFTEESCSFSRQDLLDSLQLWLDKAAQSLVAREGGASA